MEEAWALPIIQLEFCTACMQCVSACPNHAVEMRGVQPVIVRPEDCAYCGLCEEMCPAGAIALPYEISFSTAEGDHDVKTDCAH